MKKVDEEWEQANFLGFSLHTYGHSKFTKNYRKELQRIAGWNIIIDTDRQRTLDHLLIKKFCNKKYKPIAKKPWSILREEEIIIRYNHIVRGLANYYLPLIDKVAGFNRLIYIIEYSCMGTFAKKLNSSISKVKKKYGLLRIPVIFTLSETQTLKKLDKTITTSKTFKLLTYKDLDKKA